MNKLILALVLTGVMGVAACHKQVTAPIPGQINAFDGTCYRTLMDAQAALNSVKANIASGSLKLTPMQTKVFDQIITDYNTANALWQTYHAGATQDNASLTAAINQLISDIATLSTQFGGGK